MLFTSGCSMRIGPSKLLKSSVSLVRASNETRDFVIKTCFNPSGKWQSASFGDLISKTLELHSQGLVGSSKRTICGDYDSFRFTVLAQLLLLEISMVFDLVRNRNDCCLLENTINLFVVEV